MPTKDAIGLDANCLTYFVEALKDGSEPTDGLAEQKVALARCFLYAPEAFWVTPTVVQECAKIPGADSSAQHRTWMSAHISQRPLSSPESIERRTVELQAWHPGLENANDCRILAEAEDTRLTVLLSYDKPFVRRLQPHTAVKLTEPARFWGSLAIPRGASPLWLPCMDNPLVRQTWWRW
jgi:hypothetical protein